MQEYILEYVRPRQAFFRMRLGGVSESERGALPSGVSDRIYMVTQRYADAVCIMDDCVEIWEAKLIRPLTAVTQLQLYERLFRRTPEFAAYSDADIRLAIVTPIRDPDLADIAREAGIEIHYWEPEWVTEYLQGYYRITPAAEPRAGAEPGAQSSRAERGQAGN
jgi:hypothetical protein